MSTNLRTLTIDVNGEKSCLTFKEAINGEDEENCVVEKSEEICSVEKNEQICSVQKSPESCSVEMVDEENPDCVILVYAIDDRQTFGKYSFHIPLHISILYFSYISVVESTQKSKY